ncbi:rhombosortase [Vibrio sp. RE86]|uniref:rhombosortase n=1 Tax=Vibrio sp. RE86 TaxID=2607605 RepID=UPI001493769E|nr:rhombosortase [Vibrio sp. RE86]
MNYWRTISLLVLLMLSIDVIGASEWYYWQRDNLLHGEIWRLFTGQVVHTNQAHLVGNIAVLIMLCHFYESILDGIKLIALSFAIGVSISLSLFYTAIDTYLGFSGILHGLFVWCAIKEIHQGKVSGWIILIAITGKLLQDGIYGPAVSTSELIEARVAIEAHDAGALFGGIFALLSIASPIRPHINLFATLSHSR